LSWQIPELVGSREATVSIWTTAGRRKGVRVLGAPQDLVLLRTRLIGEIDLIRCHSKWFLHATVEAREAAQTDAVNGFLGVDLGIVNIPTSIDGQRAARAPSTAFVGYRAEPAGVAFVEVDPAYTSQTCSVCGWVDKCNRRSQSGFECSRYGFVGHADHNAAIVIADRGLVRWGPVMRSHAAPALTAS
jgi:transposase